TVARASRTVIAGHAFQRARSVADLLRGADDFTSPGQNLVFADVDGHIAYKAASAIPERAAGEGLWPLDARDPGAAWTRVRLPREMPALVDPPSGYVVTANNQIGTGPLPMQISH